MEPAPRRSREQFAMLAAPLVEITHARTPRLVEGVERGQIEVLGNPCRVTLAARHLEFRIGERRFEISLEDLVATAGQALEQRLKSEIAARVVAGRGAAGEAPAPRPTVGP